MLSSVSVSPQASQERSLRVLRDVFIEQQQQHEGEEKPHHARCLVPRTFILPEEAEEALAGAGAGEAAAAAVLVEDEEACRMRRMSPKPAHAAAHGGGPEQYWILKPDGGCQGEGACTHTHTHTWGVSRGRFTRTRTHTHGGCQGGDGCRCCCCWVDTHAAAVDCCCLMRAMLNVIQLDDCRYPVGDECRGGETHTDIHRQGVRVRVRRKSGEEGNTAAAGGSTQHSLCF